MKKSILIFSIVLTTFSLMALGILNSRNASGNHSEATPCFPAKMPIDYLEPFEFQLEPEFFYDVAPRFATRISKEDLHQAKSIKDILPMEAVQDMVSFNDVKVTIFDEDGERIKSGNNEIFNTAQLALLQTADYSTNFSITADSRRALPTSRNTVFYDFVYYLTVVPEKEAQFKDGQAALMNYLKENSKKDIAVVMNGKLKPGKAYFTVTQNGEIVDVALESTSGYTTIDQRMMELLRSLSGKWIPATNSEGEQVDQRLVFSFGLIGC